MNGPNKLAIKQGYKIQMHIGAFTGHCHIDVQDQVLFLNCLAARILTTC